MNIVVTGAGAMGSLFGGYLSKRNNVLLYDVSKETVSAINSRGLEITEPDGTSGLYRPSATGDPSAAPFKKADLVIVFVKAMHTRQALSAVSALIGPGTYLMSLQNGSGHEETLLEFVEEDRTVIGTTQHNAAVLAPGRVRHGGSGITHIGKLSGDSSSLRPIAEAFTLCGLETDTQDDVKRLVWEKLLTNISASALTAVFQSPLGFISSNPYAWALCEELLREAFQVAHADGVDFDAEKEISKVRAVCEGSPDGITSISADIKAGRKTEVDTISGSVVRKAERYGVPAPRHEMIVKLLHALEGRSCG